MRKLADDIDLSLLGDTKYRNNVVTGEVAVDNGNNTYDCYIAGSDVAYPKIPTIFKNPAFEVGDAVEIIIEYGHKELPVIIGYSKKIVQEFVDVDMNVIVTTLDAHTITINSAYLELRIEDIEGYENCIRYGFYYGTSTGYGSDVYTTGSITVGAYNKQITGLMDNTTYYYQAYVYDADGDVQTGEGNTMMSGLIIDIGLPAIDLPDTLTAGSTVVMVSNPANASGKITTIELYVQWADLVDCQVGTFYAADPTTYPNYLTTRDTHTIGAVVKGAKRTFTGLNITVEKGDYLGFYCSAGSLERASTGPDYMWTNVGDYIPCTNVNFHAPSGPGQTISCYGTGIEQY